MQFGYTIPLQKHLKIKGLPYGEPVDLFFCWDLHIQTILRRKAIVATNCNNRYSVLLFGVKGPDWKRLPELVREEMAEAFYREGLSEFEIARYFTLAGPEEITRTHGRKPVHGLNRAIEMLRWRSPPIDEDHRAQPLANSVMNEELCHVPGYSDYGTPREFLLEDFKRL